MKSYLISRFAFHGQFLITVCMIMIFILLLGLQAEARIWRVDADSTADDPNGASWKRAFNSIQDAIDAAVAAGASSSNPAEVWVAEGTYGGVGGEAGMGLTNTYGEEVQYPYTLVLAENVELYGGFSGSELRRAKRDWRKHRTIITGEKSRNCIHGVSNAILDGFVIRDGSAAIWGAGVYSYHASWLIRHCTFLYNGDGGRVWGAGLHASHSSLIIEDSLFAYNTSELSGGAIAGRSSSLELVNCTFFQNEAETGAALYMAGSPLGLYNCTFVDNKASLSGGALAVSSSSIATAINCIFWGNGDEIDDENGSTDITFSCIQGGYSGEGNIDANPLFVSLDQGDLRLLEDSPCIGAGSDEKAPDYDLLGVPRPQGNGVEMGAYEYDLGEGEELFSGCSCVKQGEAWEDFKYYLADYLLVALSLLCMLAWRRYK